MRFLFRPVGLAILRPVRGFSARTARRLSFHVPESQSRTLTLRPLRRNLKPETLKLKLHLDRVSAHPHFTIRRRTRRLQRLQPARNRPGASSKRPATRTSDIKWQSGTRALPRSPYYSRTHRGRNASKDLQSTVPKSRVQRPPVPSFQNSAASPRARNLPASGIFSVLGKSHLDKCRRPLLAEHRYGPDAAPHEAMHGFVLGRPVTGTILDAGFAMLNSTCVICRQGHAGS
ncbi:hypothetical protein BU26DRAFT_162899 [Trematosphaeria pertusa]|uniref:Uncharacterized protein n=1 Tax=Trematosphaeria pertusa TaxID=390896 RepID=A0A6A6HVD4_9PLEO|nr:uncharacterized protein BU26DRAFT_162899 [Trematosphaeria pertusa]KAF2241987.1 hypothetical protein BU26DRAFT_162899 [Trematosphaeria pertusa]